ncbi:MAG: hypothetical protein OJF60_002939 [Burkholderiaceae bacterium]|jgi:hypothetical protein|nr:MAG: hypothetical protein OJF60_002939 [Burkholderiaceae bacterium]
MRSATQRVRALAIDAAASRLEGAATYAELHARKPLFQKTMRRHGGAPVLVRLDWPGVLRVFDPATGELLAESVPGQPRQLKLIPAA